MSNQLTPMKELIEYINEYTPSEYEILCKAIELLPKEQQVIDDACIFGFKNPELYETHYQKAKDYYNTKFKQNESK